MPAQLLAQVPRIVVDGRFDDWGQTPPVAVGTSSARHGRVDFGQLWLAHDATSLFVRIEVGVELLLQDRNALVIFIDTDDDARTGLSMDGMGVDVAWRFGARSGWVAVGEDTIPVDHKTLGVVAAPTVTGNEFEIALHREAWPVGGPSMRVSMVDESSGGDRLPDGGGGAEYSLTGVPPPLPFLGRQKRAAEHVRFMGYNVNDHLSDESRRAAYSRILRAVSPDILVLQEVRSLDAAGTGEMLRRWAPELRELTHHAKAGAEHVVLISRFPVVRSQSTGESGVFWLDVRSRFGTDLLVVGLSAPCCDRDAQRQIEYDALMSFVRRARSGEGTWRLPPRTPVVFIGDANLVGLAEQQRTLVNGAIVDTTRYGRAFAPDWDGTSLADLMPRHTHGPHVATWYGHDFPPGRLDYVVYTDAVLGVGNRFVLHTPTMPDETLAAWALYADDTVVASDHLPVVADFILRR